MHKTVYNIQASREVVFDALLDFSQYKKWLPGCEKCEVLASSGNTTDIEMVVSGMKKMKMGLRYEAQPTQSISFSMISGNDVKSYAGTYRLMDAADGKGTVLITEMEIDASVPKFLLDRITKKSMEDSGNALAAYAKSLPAKSPASAPKASAPVQAPSSQAKPRRAKRILQVVKTDDGYRIWMMGQIYNVKSQTG